MVGDSFGAGIVAHLSRADLERQDQEHAAREAEEAMEMQERQHKNDVTAIPIDNKGECCATCNFSHLIQIQMNVIHAVGTPSVLFLP